MHPFLTLTSGKLLKAHADRLQWLLHAVNIVAVIILRRLVEQCGRVVPLVGSNEQVLTDMCVGVTIASWVVGIYLQRIFTIDW